MLGCSDVAPEQLEALELVALTDDEGETHFGGTLAVTGGPRDYTLSVSEAGDLQEFHIHSSGESDLGSLNGREVEVAVIFEHPRYALVLTDEAGPLYIANGGTAESFIESELGRSWVKPGETVAKTKEDGHRVRYTSLVFDSDDGPVALLPGEVERVELDGVAWRAAPIAAWDAERMSGPTLRCSSMLSSLSYELLRLETPMTPASVARDQNREIARYGCGWE